MPAAFLVDGITEQRFIQLVCKNSSVKLTNLNGASVDASALAKRIASLIRIWKGRFRPIVVIVDREKRDESAESFAASLLAKIREEAITDDVIVGVADRMIENWMLADPVVWPHQTLLDNVDGCAGATTVKKYLKGNYDKAAVGPQLLFKSRPSEIRQRSPSFAALVLKLSPLRCRWLMR